MSDIKNKSRKSSDQEVPNSKRQKKIESSSDCKSTASTSSVHHDLESLDLPSGRHQSSGARDGVGQGMEFQLITLLYFAISMQKNDIKFSLSTENKAAGIFDDIYIQYLKSDKKKYVLVQVKHKKNDGREIKKFMFNDFFSEQSEKSPVNLLKYFNSFCEILKVNENDDYKKSVQNHNFFIYTNADIDKNSFNEKPVKLIEMKKSVLIEDFGFDFEKTAYYQMEVTDVHANLSIFNKNKSTSFCSLVNEFANQKEKKNNSEYKHKKLKKIVDNSSEGQLINIIDLFLPRIFIACKQPDTNEVQKEIVKYFCKGASLSLNDSVLKTFQFDFNKWMNNSEGEWVGYEKFNVMIKTLLAPFYFYAETNDNFYYRDLISHDIDFVEKSFLGFERLKNIEDGGNYSGSGFIMYVKTSCVQFTSIKVAKILQKNPCHKQKDFSLFFNVSTLNNLENQREFIDNLKFMKNCTFLIFECDENCESVIDELVEKFKNDRIYGEKKIIIIYNDKYVNIFSISSAKNEILIEDNSNFFDLTNESKLKLLNTKVLFQSNKMSYYEVITDKKPKESDFLTSMTTFDLSPDAIMLLQQSRRRKTVLNLEYEPKGLSYSNASIIKLSVKIGHEDLLKTFRSSENVVYFISGLESNSVGTFVGKFKEIDSESRIFLKNCSVFQNADVLTNGEKWKSSKFIILIDCKLNEDKFKIFCHSNSDLRIFWISYSQLSGKWIWEILFAPIFFPRLIKKVSVNKNLKSFLEKKTQTSKFVFSGISSEEQFLEILNLSERELKRLNGSQNLYLTQNIEEAENIIETYKQTKIEIFWLHLQTDETFLFKNFSSSSTAKFQGELCNDLYFEKDNKSSVIVDVPGMGKTTLLTQITEKEKKNSWILRINLSKCAQLLGEFEIESDNYFFEFILACSETLIKNKLLKESLSFVFNNQKEASKRLLILMDGFDEISDKHREKVLFIIEKIQDIWKENSDFNKRLIITSREHPKVEESLNQIFINKIEGFNNDEKREYLMECFKMQNWPFLNNENSMEKLNDFVEIIIEKSESMLTKTKDFLSVPLQLQIISFAYQEECKNFILSRKSAFCINFSSLFESYVHRKGKIFYREKKDPVYEEYAEEICRNEQIKLHRKISLMKIFSKSTCENQKLMKIVEKLGLSEMISSDDELEMLKFGLIIEKTSNNNYEFVHLTIAEYFVADYLFALMTNEKFDEIQNNNLSEVIITLLAEVLNNEKHKVVRLFLNDFIAKLEKNYEKIEEPIERLLKYVKTSGMSIMHMSAKEGNDKIIEILCKNIHMDEQILEFKNELLETCLHFAIQNGHLSIVDCLLNKGAQIEAKTMEGSTSLHIAAYHGHQSVAEILLNKNANIEARGRRNLTPLLVAAMNGHLNIVEFFWSKNVQTEAKADRGFTSLHFAAREGHMSVVDFLLKNGTNIEIRTNKHHTPLHKAASKGQLAIVHFLLDNGANIEAEDLVKDTPLNIAAEVGQLAAVQLLIERGANLHREGKNNFTALHWAADKGHVEIVKYLINHKANFYAKTIDNLTPLQLAENKGHREIVSVLEEYENVSINKTLNGN